MTKKLRITKVYTRSGDDGTTGLAGKGRLPKNHPRVRAYGTIDELNAAVGLARAHAAATPGGLSENDRKRLLAELADIQNRLFTVGCDLSTRIADRWDGMPTVSEEDTRDLEKRIDEFNESLPPLEDFILPTGHPTAAALHLARTICRRAEREALSLREVEPIGDPVIPFLNRLSDHLFVLARWITVSSGEKETVWNH